MEDQKKERRDIFRRGKDSLCKWHVSKFLKSSLNMCNDRAIKETNKKFLVCTDTHRIIQFYLVKCMK